jgi:GTPase SAR1 family protein
MTLLAQGAYENARERIAKCWVEQGTALNLAGLGLTALPPELFQLRALTILRLDNNQLTALPPELGQLTALTGLGLENNKLTTLPPELFQLTALSDLRLSSNQLITLPPELGQLTALEVLFLDNIQLTALPPELGQLRALRELALSNNQLTALPPELGQLTALTGLALNNNQLTTLPPELGQLTALTGLYLDKNQLTALPPELGQLKALKGLFLHGNPDLDLPAEVLGPSWQDVISNKGTAAAPRGILDHYFARVQQGERALNEVRLVLVGRGSAGKTSLVRRLVHDRFDPKEKETPGIALSDWVMRGCAGEPVTAHVWDFAGQVITHSMHRYFLSHRTIYILVLTQREDMAGEDAEYWLKLIESYGTETQADGTKTSPPVLVALNKSNQATVKVDRGALQERHPSICAFIETDCEDGRGIEDLRARLCELMDDPKVKPWVRQGYPKKWWDVKEAIRKVQQDRPHVSYDEWRMICAGCGVTDAKGQDAASRDLHTLGVALNYADDERLHDNTVLRPNWVTHHCYNLIRHATTQKGELNQSDLPAVLGAGDHGEHEPKLHFYLMRLMERFEAAYPLGEEWPPQRWLVPLALPDSQPAGVEVFGKAAPEDAARLRYTYNSVPPGLLAQFIVRTHPLMEPQMQWASGTVLTLNEARALVRAVSKTEVEVTAIGCNPDARRDLAGLCRDELNGLNAQITGLEFTERTEVVAEGERVWVKVPTLEKDELKGKTKTAVETSEGSAEVVTKKELDEFGTEEGRLPEVPRDPAEKFKDDIRGWTTLGSGPPRRRSKPKPRLFISYCHQDERHLKTLNLHLTVLKNLGLIHKVWHDRRIQPGMDWDRAIQEEITKADVVIFLTSTASLASGYINQHELRPALNRHLSNKAVFVPIILEPCDWVDSFANSPPLKRLKERRKRVPQGLPRDNHAINSFTPRSIGWHQVSEGLKALLTEVKAKLK